VLEKKNNHLYYFSSFTEEIGMGHILYRLQMEPHGFIDGFSGIGCGGLLQEVKDHPCPGFSMQLRFKYSSELL